MRSLVKGVTIVALFLVATGTTAAIETGDALHREEVEQIALTAAPLPEPLAPMRLAQDVTCGYQSWYDPATPGLLLFKLGGTDATGPDRWMGARFEAPGISELVGLWVYFWTDPSAVNGEIILEAWDNDGPVSACGPETPGTKLRRLAIPTSELAGSGWHYITFADPTGVIWGADDGALHYLFVSLAFHPAPGESGFIYAVTDWSEETGCGMDPHTVIRETSIGTDWYYVGELYGEACELIVLARICTVECTPQSWYDPVSDDWKEYELIATPHPFWRRLGVRYDFDGPVEFRGFWFWLTEYGVPYFGQIEADVRTDLGAAQSCGRATPGPRLHFEIKDIASLGLTPGWNYFPFTARHVIQCGDGPGSLFTTMSFLNPVEPLVLLASAPTVAGCGPDPHSIIRPEGTANEWVYLGEWAADPYQSELKMVADICPAPIKFTATPAVVRRTGPAVVFEATSGVPLTNWYWSFGDGGSSTEPSPVHLYTTPGSYRVILQATGEDGETYLAYYPDCVKVGSLLADFTATPRTGLAPMTVTFTDLSEGTPTEWHWDFGDGGTSNEKQPTYTYMTPGEYSVTLVVSCTDSPIGPDTDQITRTGYIMCDDTPRQDLAVWVVGSDLARPGFDKCYSVVVRNEGSVPSPAGEDLTFILPPTPRCEVISTNPPGTLMPGKGVNEQVVWTIDPLAAWESRTYEVCIRIAEDAVSGSILNVTAITSLIPGEAPTNNTFHEGEEIRSSWDPNAKFANPIGCGPDHLLAGDERLVYSIFFENKAEATADAIYALVLDTLDATLDWNTLQFGPTSHDDVMMYDFDPVSREIMWFFDHINLPPNVNPPEGEGFVSFTIKPMLGLSQGTVIPNRAHIRFDYNPWIAAPEEGSVERVILECCDCPCHGDPVCDGQLDVLDVLKTVDVAFREKEAIVDLYCAHEPGGRTDVNCDGVTNVQDIVAMVAAVFRGQTGNICDPCACDPYPTDCP